MSGGTSPVGRRQARPYPRSQIAILEKRGHGAFEAWKVVDFLGNA
jgi:hypothetical protein